MINFWLAPTNEERSWMEITGVIRIQPEIGVTNTQSAEYSGQMSSATGEACP
ncbi:MAG: hypothetical protein HOI23_13770 [Deltaproteobacteria bacterium]|nr:hypothetical protein [Deltaproteobacteria bacterium]